MRLNQITFHPFRENILDYIGRNDLETPDGKKVIIDRSGTFDFAVRFDGEEVFRGDSNLSVSGFLNDNNVGISK